MAYEVIYPAWDFSSRVMASYIYEYVSTLALDPAPDPCLVIDPDPDTVFNYKRFKIWQSKDLFCEIHLFLLLDLLYVMTRFK